MDERAARAYHALTGVVAGAGVALALRGAIGEWGRSASVLGRVVDELSYFTVQSAVLVAVTSLALAAGAQGRSTAFRVLRVAAVVAIALTGVVYHAVLAGQVSPRGAELVADVLLHTVTPIMGVAGWLGAGPRERLPWRLAAASVAFPLWWAAYTLVRGELVVDRLGHPWYPYGLVDVGAVGYLAVLRNVAVLLVVVSAFTAGAWWGSGRLPATLRRTAWPGSVRPVEVRAEGPGGAWGPARAREALGPATPPAGP